jgi:hypothetical protein
MNCEQARNLAALAASGDVTPEEQNALELHNAGCAGCSSEVNAFAELCGQLSSMRDESAPDHIYAAIRARVTAGINDRRRPRWVAASGAFAAALACSVVLVVALRHDVPVVVQPVPHPATEAVASVSDEAPAVTQPPPVRRVYKPAVRALAKGSVDPLVVQMFTQDPDVVIYWIADAKGTRARKEIIQ